MSFEDAFVATDRGRLFTRRWRPGRRSDGAPIVLFHDSLGCVALWRDFPDKLVAATGRDVVAYDRLGFGRSDPHPGPIAHSFIHDEARGGFRFVREQLGLEAFVAFGYSVGGGMAAGCAAAHPDACAALVTESAQAFVEDRTLAGVRDAQVAFARPGQLERLAKYHGDKAAWVLSAWIDTWLDPAYAGWTLDADLGGVRCPALVIHGDADEYGTVAHPQRIASRVAGPATTLVLPDCGHMPHREREAEVLSAVAVMLPGAANTESIP
jgi:pimeloyl-ACP methyl ester carboxylesterase